MKIKDLFNEGELDRKIEKVISYDANTELNLKSEISEYIVTKSIENKLLTLLESMQRSMDADQEDEIGVWVSGFYGSGKSSFTKYLGCSFDDKYEFDGLKFREHFRNRLNSSQTKALLSSITKRFPCRNNNA